MSRRTTFLFLLLAIGNLTAEYFNYSLGIYITKPLLLLSLAFIFYRKVDSISKGFEKWLFAGLLFSCGGDVLLMFSQGETGSLFFIAGLSSFLIGHICYISAFFNYPKRGIQLHPFSVLFFYGIALALVFFLWPNLDPTMKIAVSAYALTISTMGIFAYGMYNKASYSAAAILLFGAICFIFSDSIIAINKFNTELSIWMPRITIMSSYILAQWLIVQGSIQTSREKELNATRIATSPNG
jgi:uncharacterized membrane protein YhhN